MPPPSHSSPSPPKDIHILICASDGRIVQTPMRPLVRNSIILQRHLLKYCSQKDYHDPVIHCEKKFDVGTLVRVIEWCYYHGPENLYLRSADFAKCQWKNDFLHMDPTALAKLVDAALFFRISSLMSYFLCPLPRSERVGGKEKVWHMMTILPGTKDKFTAVEYLLRTKAAWDNILEELAIVHAKNEAIIEAYKRLLVKVQQEAAHGCK